MLHKDVAVFSLLGLAVLLEVLSRLLFSVLPERFARWRRRSWWRWLRRWQSFLCFAALMGVFLAYRYPSSPPGLLEDWIHGAETFVADLREEGFSIPAQLGRVDIKRGRVFKVIDGDSLLIRFEGGEIVESQMFGIDAPEWSQPHGKAAKRALSWKLAFRKVEVEIRDVDKYERRVVVLTRKGRNINREMVCEGHAWWYARYAPGATDLKRCEVAAREQGIGLWDHSKPVPPWLWRRLNPRGM